ncbi:MAG TPA: hypothetical protein VM077_06105 [Candidatus Limnocylindrales bacterium]|nr:hypothetical protein [Candidatus Limnocylindrales bacterium]
MAANASERLQDALQYIDLLFPGSEETIELREHVESTTPDLPMSFKNAAVKILSIVESGNNIDIFERAMTIERNQNNDEYLDRDRSVYGGIFHEVSSFRMSQELIGTSGQALDDSVNKELRRRLSGKIARKYGSMALGFNPEAQPDDPSSFDSIIQNPHFTMLQEAVNSRFLPREA